MPFDILAGGPEVFKPFVERQITTWSKFIKVTARHWSQQVEWALHAPIARKAGVSVGTIAAIQEGRTPVPPSKASPLPPLAR